MLLSNSVGEFHGRAFLAAVKPGSLQVHWPEGEVLIDHIHRSRAGAPDYNAFATVSRLDGQEPGSPAIEPKAVSVSG
jgi:hypothetical protein